ncbi:MAG: sugar-binding transcriptional regulator [Erysipelotrichaceae bacterium]
MQEQDKINILVRVAKAYYVEGCTQNEIAKRLHVSRPLVSKYLNDAKEAGIVRISIHEPVGMEQSLGDQLISRFQLKAAHVVAYSSDQELVAQWLSEETLALFEKKCRGKSMTIGLGWGSTIGRMALHYDAQPPKQQVGGVLVPLLANAPTSNRNYHTNELVRMMARSIGSDSRYLYAPLICAGEQELLILQKVESYQQLQADWNNLDYAWIQIRNHPSIPDLGTEARFGRILNKKKAVGMLLGHYFDVEGHIIESSQDFTMQIPIASLAKTKRLVGVVGTGVTAAAVLGALRTGLFHHIILDSKTASEVLEYESA